MCSKVVKTSVCPQALLTLREQTRAFGQDTRNALSKKNSVENSEKHQVVTGFMSPYKLFKKLLTHITALLNQTLCNCVHMF